MLVDMKKPILILTVLLAMLTWQCETPNRVLLSELNHPRYKYILDFESKVSQQKMRNLKRNYAQAWVAVAFIDGMANSMNPNQNCSDRQETEMPKVVRQIRIINEGRDT